MDFEPDPWLAALIRRHQDPLAAELAAEAIAAIPFYRTLPPTEVVTRFAAFYTALTATAGGDPTALRTYLETVVQARLQAGVPAARFIDLAGLARGGCGPGLRRNGPLTRYRRKQRRANSRPC